MPFRDPVSLIEYLRGCASNAEANVFEQTALMGFVAEIHDLYGETIDRVLGDAESAGLFLGMSHGAFLAAFQLAASGEFPPTYAVVRMCVEHALVAHRLHHNPEFKPVWFSRDASAAATEVFRRKFRYRVMKAELDANHPAIGHQFSTVYESCISFGAHPNPAALMTNIRHEPENATGYRYKYLIVSGDDQALKQALYTVAFGGLTALTVFAFVYQLHFVKTDLGERLALATKLAYQFAPPSPERSTRSTPA